MTRTDIRDSFRALCPEITTDVISDTALNAMLLVGDKEVCARTRCIPGEYEWTCVADDQHWDLTAKIPTFYAIDDFPGGGVYYSDDKLDPTTIAELDESDPGWRTASSGSPDKYFIRGKELWVDKPIETADTITVYFIAISDDFNSDGITPYNQLTHLTPYHNALVLYLTMRAKAQAGKESESLTARQEYNEYIAMMKKEINSAKKGRINLEPRYW